MLSRKQVPDGRNSLITCTTDNALLLQESVLLRQRPQKVVCSWQAVGVVASAFNVLHNRLERGTHQQRMIGTVLRVIPAQSALCLPTARRSHVICGRFVRSKQQNPEDGLS